jgi:hypothetical protein
MNDYSRNYTHLADQYRSAMLNVSNYRAEFDRIAAENAALKARIRESAGKSDEKH